MLVLNVLFSPTLHFCVARSALWNEELTNNADWWCGKWFETKQINITIISHLTEYINKLGDICSGFRVLIFLWPDSWRN